MVVQTVSLQEAGAAARFTATLRETGFGVLSDHGIRPDLLADVMEDWQGFFASDRKFRYRFDANLQAGYFPFGTENAKGAGLKDLKEFFHLYSWNALPEGVSVKTR